MRCDQVLARESGTVVKHVLVIRDAGLSEKSAQNFESAFDGSSSATLASQQAQQNFRVQVLAHLVDYAYIFYQRLGFVTGQRDGLVGLERTRGAFAASAGWRDGGCCEGGKRSEFGVARALMPIDSDATLLKQLTEKASGELGGIFDGERFSGAGVVERQVPPERKGHGTGFTIDKELSSGA